MRIPFVDLQAQYRAISGEIDAAMAAVVRDCAFVSGKYAAEFERDFSAFCGARHCIGVGNGTDALYIALRASGIGPGDEVLVPANSFIATSEAVALTGARVVFVDVDPDTYNIDVEQAHARLTSRTKATIAVHLYGQPAKLDDLVELSRSHGLKLIQDSAQAHGASLHGKPLSAYSDLSCYSFYPGKNLGAYGDAGAVVTNDDDLARTCRMIANHGRISKYDHEFEGVNSRLDGLQGAILSVKLRSLDQWIAKRRAVAALYDRLLDSVDEVITPLTIAGARHVYHLYVVRVPDREDLQQHLKDRGVATGVHYPTALPNLTAYSHLGCHPKDFPVASRYQSEILSLPIYPELAENEVRHVVAEIQNHYAMRRLSMQPVAEFVQTAVVAGGGD